MALTILEFSSLNTITMKIRHQVFKYCMQLCGKYNADQSIFEELIKYPQAHIGRKEVELIIRKELVGLFYIIKNSPSILSTKALKEIQTDGYIAFINKVGIAKGEVSGIFFGDFINLMFSKGIAEASITKLVEERIETMDASVLVILLKYRKEGLAAKLVRDNFITSNEVLISGIYYNCFSFATFYLTWLEGTKLKSPDILFDFILRQLVSDIANSELHLLVIRKLANYITYSFAIDFAEQVQSQIEEEIIFKGVANPIKIGVLIIELLEIISGMYPRARIKMKLLKESLVSILTSYQNEIDIEKYEQLLFFDKDLENRDTLSVSCFNDVPELFEHQTMELISDQIWNSQYSIEGNLITSGSYICYLLFSNFWSRIDEEKDIRDSHFFRRDPDFIKTHRYQFSIWKNSIHLRYLLDSFIPLGIFVVVAANIFIILNSYSNMPSNWMNLPIQQIVILFMPVIQSIEYLLYIFIVVILAFCQHIFTILFAVLTDRRASIKMPEIVVDFLCCLSAIYYAYIAINGLIPIQNSSSFQDQFYAQMALLNTPPLYYAAILVLFFSAIRAFLTFRGVPFVGPFLKMVWAMVVSTSVFSGFYFLTVLISSFIMYVIIQGSVPKPEIDPSFTNLYQTIITMFAASLGMGDFSIFNGFLIPQVIFACYLVMEVIIIVNIVIAMLTKIYEDFKANSRSQYILDIVFFREYYDYHQLYGCLVAGYFPINMIFAPIATIMIILLIPFPKIMARVNEVLLWIEYLFILPLLLAIYIPIQSVFCVFAVLKTILHKFHLIFLSKQNKRCTAIREAFLFLFLGVFIFISYFFMDIFYFISNCLSTSEPQKDTYAGKISDSNAKYYYWTLKDFHSNSIANKEKNMKFALDDSLNFIKATLGLNDQVILVNSEKTSQDFFKSMSPIESETLSKVIIYTFKLSYRPKLLHRF